MSISLGILDQSIVTETRSAAEALADTVRLAQIAEQLGYDRFWVSEHHDMSRLAGSSPEVLVSYLLAKTQRIRIGSGGVMLQHYSPYKVAENFNVLATLAPGRVELGVGRAPGGLPRSTQALQQGTIGTALLEDKLRELDWLLHGPAPDDHAWPGLQATPLPVHPAHLFLLGTSLSSAELAASRGYPYAFALFINNDPDTAQAALTHYRQQFQPIAGRKPEVILALSVIAADTEEEAAAIPGLGKSIRVTLASGKTINVGSLEQAAEYARQAGESYSVEEREADIVRGSRATIRKRLLAYVSRYQADALILTTIIPNFEQRVRSLQIVKEALHGVKTERGRTIHI